MGAPVLAGGILLVLFVALICAGAMLGLVLTIQWEHDKHLFRNMSDWGKVLAVPLWAIATVFLSCIET